MARPGITYEDVSSAALQLKDLDRNPTIETVRALLGTGSSSTINAHLRKWKNLQQNVQKAISKENLPEELLSLMRNLWERVMHEAETRIEQMEKTHQAVVAALQIDVEKYKTNNRRWQQLYQHWVDEKTQLKQDKESLAADNAALKKDLSVLTARQEVLSQQSQEKQERIQELHQLHKQTQANLEHYREATREQRLLDQEHFEQQKRELQTSLQAITEQFHLEKDKNVTLDRQHQFLQQTHLALEQQHTQGQTELQEAQEKFELQIKELLELDGLNKQLGKQLAASRQAHSSTLDANKALTHAKATLQEEKNRLEQQLQQLQLTLVQQAYKHSKKLEEF